MTAETFKIRPAVLQDAATLVKLYSYYVEQTAITFEYTVPSIAEFKKRMLKISRRYPYLVALVNQKIVGYAYLSAFHPRAAYGWSAEISIYLDPKTRHQGIGSRLYAELEKIARAQNILNLNACISFSETQTAHLPLTSVYFHKKMGYVQTAHFHQCGYKFSTWYDMIWMEKILAAHTIPAPSFHKFPEISTAFYTEPNTTDC
ncbi:GNAT family N-acetyltransferase [Liquorilactobacillus satsumensis]|uniref:Acetyltransferase n=1 Tax=Liquorilactobacillus satsumensis DSM 16230 = JCM 12392 TaxID=1423801 RepID=A0A0R1V372_9LACO|nr:GNAT family N-acetyltransferase [Liquorilactobacillus satsumensis]KRM00064.1 acetyltransferase [Liquorilactobacillus satsumensis DSM 16230 = JCM 12392]MCC7667023.1 N-acetyltransferase [Liquorilactobacillus satsumensis]MCP9358136.1 N-acetyltransferase [Liquorilactobacillus satsumensis]MCP9372147.1 N-acetyltransferase [Liquorilactobacillus satsumensis]